MIVGVSAPELPPVCYGVGRYTYNLLLALQQKGVETYVLGDLSNQKFMGYNTNPSGSRRILGRWAEFYVRYYKGIKELEKSADVYHNNFQFHLRSKLPTITVTHTSLWQMFRLGKSLLMKLDAKMLNASDLIASTSPVLTESLLRNGISKEKIRTITPGVWVKEFKPTSKKSDFVFFSGRFNHDKNFPALIRAARNFKTKLVVAGSNPQGFGMQHAVKNVEVKGFMKNRSELVSLFQSAKAFILPSKFETFGIVGLEAMASGTPLIISKNAGLSYYLRDGKDALVIEPTEAAITEAVNTLVEDRALQNKLRKNGLKKVREFDWSKLVEKYLAAYESLLKA